MFFGLLNLVSQRALRSCGIISLLARNKKDTGNLDSETSFLLPRLTEKIFLHICLFECIDYLIALRMDGWEVDECMCSLTYTI